MELLGSAGFDLYPNDPNLLTSQMTSPVLSPVLTDDSLSLLELGPDITTDVGAVLTRTRSSTDASIRLASSLQLAGGVTGDTGSAKADPKASPLDEGGQNAFQTPTRPRSKSHSPTSGEVRVLAPDLACVGLSDDNVENWSLKIIKLVAFPELIAPHLSIQTSSSGLTTTNVATVAAPLHTVRPESRNSAFEPFSTVMTPPISIGRGRTETISSSSSSSSGEDGYFSYSPPDNNNSVSSLVSSSPSASRSFPDITKTASMGPSFKPTIKRLVTPLSPIDSRPSPAHRSTTKGPTSVGHRESESVVGFFSFTRTGEGSSLTTDASLLSTLFPPDERHMVISRGELDAVDDPATAENDLDDDVEKSGLVKCLQIDLRRFGLGELCHMSRPRCTSYHLT